MPGDQQQVSLMRKPRVAYDHKAFSAFRFGGVSRYFAKLIGKARQSEHVSVVTPYRFIMNQHMLLEEPGRFRTLLLNRSFRGEGRILNALNTFRGRRVLRRGDFDLLHPTSYDPWFLEDLGEKPYVMTVYDLIHELYANRFTAAELMIEDKRPLLPRAARIMTISDSTRADLIRLYNIAPDRVVTVHLGGDHVLDDARAPSALAAPALPDRYVLFVGTRGRYKNFDRFASVLAPLMAARPDLHLVCVGGRSLEPEEMVPFAALLGRIHHLSAHDSQLQSIYSRAQMLVFPSLYEGFGLPLVEAFFCGCPVACADRSSFPEVAGDAAVYFDPENAESMSDAIIRLLDGRDLRGEMRRRGEIRAKDFTWRQTADRTVNIYSQTV